MMNERIKELADEADNYAKQTVHYYNGQFEGLTWEGKLKQVRDKKFAALVAAQEREACAKIADRQNGDDEQDSESCVWSKAARHIAAAIRARGSK
jgi:hypothetical protein